MLRNLFGNRRGFHVGRKYQMLNSKYLMFANYCLFELVDENGPNYKHAMWATRKYVETATTNQVFC